MASDPTGAPFNGRADFLAALALAELSASGEWEIEFTKDVRDRWEKLGDGLVLTQLQQTTIRRIAGLTRRNWTI